MMSAGARPDPPPARQPRPGHDLGGRHQRRGARHRPLARRADLRHRRLAAEGAHRDVLLGRLRRRRAQRQSRRRRAPVRHRRRAPSSAIPPPSPASFAFGDRSIGNISRPYFPDGELEHAARALLAPGRRVQSLLDRPAVGADRGGDARPMSASSSAPIRTSRRPARAIPTPRRLANGIQIFPGSVPIYRGNQLVGGIGVSGDGIDQDDMISFLGLHNAGVRLGAIGNADSAIRVRPDRRPGRRRRAAALRQLPVRAVPRHQRPECLPGEMTLAALFLSL